MEGKLLYLSDPLADQDWAEPVYLMFIYSLKDSERTPLEIHDHLLFIFELLHSFHLDFMFVSYLNQDVHLFLLNFVENGDHESARVALKIMVTVFSYGGEEFLAVN